MLSTKPKIAILSLHPSNGGGILSSLSVVYEYLSRFFEPTVFFLSFDPALSASFKKFKFTSRSREATYYGMNCVEVGARWAFWEPGHYAFTLDAWKKVLKGYDYFFVTSGTAIAAYPLVLLNKRYVAWIAAPHDDDRADRIKDLSFFRKIIEDLGHSQMRAIEAKSLGKCRYLFALSHYAYNHFLALRGKSKYPMSVCGYPMKIKKPLVSTEMRQKAGHLLAVARFDDPRKNIGMLLRAFDVIYHHQPERPLVIVGRRPESHVLAPYASLPSFKNVLFTGPVSAAELERWYQQASVMLITSHQEGLGIVGLEALSYGIPVVATRCGGPADYVINGKTGFLVNKNDDATMARVVLKLLEDKVAYEECAREAHAFLAVHNDSEHIYNTFTEGLCTAYPELTAYLKMPYGAEVQIHQEWQQQ